jgi:site-specific DNA-methyltransferase (adenine-specific)
MSEGKKEILLGDCLELMKDIPNGSIDMILADLPYGTTQNKWDSIIPLDELWKEYKRIVKDDGAIVLTSMQPFTSSLILSNSKEFKYCWYWKKNRATGVLNAKKQPLRNIEEICVFRVKKYKAQGLIEYNKPSRNGKKDSPNYGKGKTNSYTQKWTNYPTQLLIFDSVQRVVHPTQKPVELFEYLIKTYTNENELVLDNTAGSGTTAIACLKTNRQFIVMEKEQKYYDIILKRVGDFNKKFEPQTLFGNEM